MTEVGERCKQLAGQTVKVQLGRVTKYLTIYVAEDENSPALLGRDWIKAFFRNGWIRRLTINVIGSVDKTSQAEGNTYQVFRHRIQA